MFHVEVELVTPGNHDRGPLREWRKVHPTGEKPYEFPNREVAERFIRKWYPRQEDMFRVVPA
jgi:hypothetical protein